MMKYTDTRGRPWATVNDTKVGSILVPDDTFSCMLTGGEHEVFSAAGDLCITCSHGHHMLSGQWDEAIGCEPFYVGLYHKCDTHDLGFGEMDLDDLP